MWPIPALEHELCTVSFSPDSVACGWIQQTKNGATPLVLHAYQRYHCDNLELENLTLFNPTIIKKYIASFMREHNKQDAFIVFSLDGPGIVEQFVALPTSTPRRADFGITQSSTIAWDYRYLYPNDHGQFIFYLYTVPRSRLLQYQLLAVALQCNLIAITTKKMALLTTYQHIFGPAFRRSQLAIDMMRYNNNLEAMISADTLKRLLNVSSSVAVHDELSYLAAACGLFFDERIVE